jgi:hypothetical protein
MINQIKIQNLPSKITYSIYTITLSIPSGTELCDSTVKIGRTLGIILIAWNGNKINDCSKFFNKNLFIRLGLKQDLEA